MLNGNVLLCAACPHSGSLLFCRQIGMRFRMERKMTMITLNSDGTFHLSGGDCCTDRPRQGSIELSADLLARQSELIDRILDFALDVLDLTTVELRVREVGGGE